MNFWESELGEVTGAKDDAFAKDVYKTIPDGTMALAKIDSFVNAEYDGFKYLSIEWALIDGEFKGRKVQQKLKVFGGSHYDKDSAKTRHRALNMLKLIYQLFSLSPSHRGEPTDHDLSVFCGKIAGLKIRETEPNVDGKQYNWVAEVHESRGFKSETGVAVVVKHDLHSEQGNLESAFSRNRAKVEDDFDLTDIPF